jgi:hypothetical protein
MRFDIHGPAAIVKPMEEASIFLAEATGEHQAGLGAQQKSLEHFRKAGEALRRAKTAAGHGRWLPLLNEQTDISHQRASEYMRLAAGWDKLPLNGSFTLKEALRLIAGEPPAEDGETRDELMRKVSDEIALIGVGGVKSLRLCRDIGLLLAGLQSRASSAAEFRRALHELAIGEAAAQSMIRFAQARGEGWEPTLKDGEEYIDHRFGVSLHEVDAPKVEGSPS